jgi:hypothetical protein
MPARTVCDRCGYDLTGIITADRATCPECGTANTLTDGRIQRHSWPAIAYSAVIVWPVLPFGLLVAHYNHVFSREIAQFGSPMNQSEALEPLLFNLAFVAGAWLIASMLGVAICAFVRPTAPQRRRALIALLVALPAAAALLFLPTLIVQLLVG